jgi:hypothetical protein
MSKYPSQEKNNALLREKLEEPRSKKLLGRIPEMESFAYLTYHGLNCPRYGKYQNGQGGYQYRKRIGLRDFDFHLRGHDSIAVSAVHGEKVNFIAVDVDEKFEERLPIFADVLRKRGLAKASFAISGSSRGRGKVVVTLAERLPQRQGIALVASIIAEATADPRFGPYKKKDLTTWPQCGDGGHVRIFGRNLRRVRTRALTEAPLDLGGDLSDLCYVEPANIAADLPEMARSKSALSSWAEGFINEPYVGATPDLFKAQCRLAYEAVALHGEAGAEAFLTEAFREIERQSTDLSRSARQSLLRADTVKRLVKYAASGGSPSSKGGHVISQVLVSCPKNKLDAPKGAVRVYQALWKYVLDYALDPCCFGMSFERIADLADYSGATKAREAVLKAVAAGLIVRLDCGVPKRDGIVGLHGLYALVGHDITPDEARAAGQRTAMYAARSRERIARGLPSLQMLDEELPTAA